MKTYKLNTETMKGYHIVENCYDHMMQKGKSEAEAMSIMNHLHLPQKHSKTKSLYQMSNETARWLHYEVSYRIQWTEDVIRDSYSDEAYDHRLDLGRLKTLLRQLEAQM